MEDLAGKEYRIAPKPGDPPLSLSPGFAHRSQGLIPASGMS